MATSDYLAISGEDSGEPHLFDQQLSVPNQSSVSGKSEGSLCTRSISLYPFKTETDESLQPSQRKVEIEIEKARVYWYSLAERALCQHQNGLATQYLNLQAMLNRVPAIPNGAKLDLSPESHLTTWAQSNFQISGSGKCIPEDNSKEIPAICQLGILQPTQLELTGTNFHRWIGTEGESSVKENLITVLALGWSYILSTRLVELQGRDGAEVIYTGSIVNGYGDTNGDKTTDAAMIDIGDVEPYIARWWAAILAPGQGWKAIMLQHEKGAYLAPWSIFLKHNPPLRIKRQSYTCNQPNIKPPSSKQALGFLAEFTALHDLGSQFSAALATILMFPTHNYNRSVAKLPFPTTVSLPKNQKMLATNMIPDIVTLDNTLAYYMTMSCTPYSILSSLCGVFWQQGIPCNLVSPWLHPILNEILAMKEITDIQSRYDEIIAIICAIRCPKLAALWLGAAICELIPLILKFVKSGTPPLDPIAVAWTGCPQSFMDIPGSGPYFHSESIRRADVWRLLHLPTVIDDDLYYKSRPFAPWEPPGTTTLWNSADRVRIHAQCKRHFLDYKSWSWNLADGSILSDQGLHGNAFDDFPCDSNSFNKENTNPRIPIETSLYTDDASCRASRQIFNWVTVNGEGHPHEDVYYDKWLRIYTDSESSSPSKEPPTLSDLDSSPCNMNTIDGENETFAKNLSRRKISEIKVRDWLEISNSGD